MSSLKSISNESFHYVYDLRWPQLKELSEILDIDDRWKELGGRYMNVSPIDLFKIGKAIYVKESPTQQLLTLFGTKNGTIDELFMMLSKMEHFRAMHIIKNFVSSKYLYLLEYEVENRLDCWYQSPQPSAPTKQYESGANNIPSTTYKSNSDNESKNPSLNLESFNFNKPVIDQPLPFKLNGIEPKTLNDKVERPASNKSNQTQSRSSSEEGAAAPRLPARERSDGLKKLNIPVPPDSLENTAAAAKHKSLVSDSASSIIEDIPSVMRIPFEELLKGTNNFHKDRILGQGGFGIVYKGEWRLNQVAVKKLSPRKAQESDLSGRKISLQQSLNEMKVLNSCRIDNILPLYGVCLDGPEPCLVYQYMINGSLEDRLQCRKKTEPLNWIQRYEIAEGTARGLNFLHSLPEKPLVHGDIKSANILLDREMKPKIGDFGLTREGPKHNYTHMKVSSVHGTKFYLPPEYLNNQQLSPKVDIYSYGIVMFEMATGERAYNDRRDKHKLLHNLVTEMVDQKQEETIKDTKAGKEDEEWFEELLIIGQKCSSIKKNKRPSMADVLRLFQSAKDKISMTDRVRRLSKETNNLPKSPQMSPREIQLWYDIKNGPKFMEPPKDYYRFPPTHKNETGPQEMLELNYQSPIHTNPSEFSSIHVSQVREPPSLTEPSPSLIPDNRDFSCQATAGSSNYEENNLPPPSETNQDDSSAGSVPYLTMLGTKQPKEEDRASSDNLGPTPQPSGVLSQSRESSKIILTNIIKGSNLLEEFNSEDSDSSDNDEDLN